jgi:DNA sulfur modification protein DndB
LAKEIVEAVGVFRGLTEMDKATISNRSVNLFTLSSIYFATRQLLRKGLRAPITRHERSLAKAFWSEVSKNMPDWQRAADRLISSARLRAQFIHAHGVALQAIAMAGADLIDADPKGWRRRLEALQTINWERANRQLWEGRATIGGRVSKATNNVVLTANVIKEHLGLVLLPSEETVERIHDDAKRRSISKPDAASSRAAHAERQPATSA